MRATAIELEPLGAEDSEKLIDALTDGRRDLPTTTRALLDEDRGQPAVPRGDRCGCRRVRRGACGEGDPGHGPGADRRAHRPARRRREGRAPAGVGRSAACSGAARSSTSRRSSRASTTRSTTCCCATSSSRSRARRSAARGVPLQARAHPRRRLRGPDEVGARDAPRALRRVAARAGRRRAPRDPRATTSTRPRRSSRSSTAPRRAELAARRPGRARGGRPARARHARRTAAARKLFLRAVELEPTLERRYLAAQAAWRLDDLPAVAREMEAVARRRSRIGDKKLEGRALTALADTMLHAPGRCRSRAPRARRAGARGARGRRRRRASTRFGSPGRSRAGSATSRDSERYAIEELELARAAGRRISRAIAIQSLAQHYDHRGLELDEAEPLVRARARARRGERQRFSARGRARVRGVARDPAASCARGRGGVRRGARALRGGRHRLGVASHEDDARPVGLRAAAISRRPRSCSGSRSGAEALDDRGDALREPARARGAAGRARTVEEAERFALEARETVGPEDRVSSRRRRSALGRGARRAGPRRRGRGALPGGGRGLRASTASARSSARCSAARSSSSATRGRDDEAARYEERLAELLPSSTAPIA